MNRPRLYLFKHYVTTLNLKTQQQLSLKLSALQAKVMGGASFNGDQELDDPHDQRDTRGLQGLRGQLLGHRLPSTTMARSCGRLKRQRSRFWQRCVFFLVGFLGSWRAGGGPPARTPACLVACFSACSSFRRGSSWR